MAAALIWAGPDRWVTPSEHPQKQKAPEYNALRLMCNVPTDSSMLNEAVVGENMHASVSPGGPRWVARRLAGQRTWSDSVDVPRGRTCPKL